MTGDLSETPNLCWKCAGLKPINTIPGLRRELVTWQINASFSMKTATVRLTRNSNPIPKGKSDRTAKSQPGVSYSWAWLPNERIVFADVTQRGDRVTVKLPPKNHCQAARHTCHFPPKTVTESWLSISFPPNTKRLMLRARYNLFLTCFDRSLNLRVHLGRKKLVSMQRVELQERKWLR